MSNILLLKEKNAVTTLVLNRPEKFNAFDNKMIRIMNQHIKELAEDDNCQVLCIKGQGSHFSAGADLEWMQSMVNYSEQENIKDAALLSELMENLAQFPKPTIAVVQGKTFGGGIGLIACCDIVIAADNAEFCFSEIKLGLIPAIISPYIRIKIGDSRAKFYFLSGYTFNAEQAQKDGLIHCIYAEKDLQQLTKNWLNNLNKLPMHAQIENKALFSSPSKEVLIKQISDLRTHEKTQSLLKKFLKK